MGLDLYYKDARDLIDDGQFGQAVVLTQFNWARGYSEGGEVKAKYTIGNFYAYANFAVNVTRAIGPESNQYLLDADEFNYLLTHGHYTDDMQLMTGSGGAWYRWNNYLFTTNLVYGSGQRSGFANQEHTPPYVTVNAGIAKEIRWSPDLKPITLRLTCSICSTRPMSCATVAVSGFLHRNLVRAVDFLQAFRRSCEASQTNQRQWFHRITPKKLMVAHRGGRAISSR
jgi:hypothetical protein